MSEYRPITLTTDFGHADGYVAAMKGAILGIRPDATLIDVAHGLPSHDVPHAAFVVGTACAYFPAGAVHVAVVDPGVGTERRPLLLVTPRGSFVAPDNGLLTYVLKGYETAEDVGVSATSECARFLEARADGCAGPL